VCLLAPASVRGEEPEGVLPRDGEGRALYARFLALGVLDDLEPEAPAFGPSPVHPGEHLGPVLRIHPAGAGVYGEYGIALVVLAGEEPGDLLFLQDPLDPPQLFGDLEEQLAVPFGELQQLLGIGEAPP
jgi:hypothetical protein